MKTGNNNVRPGSGGKPVWWIYPLLLIFLGQAAVLFPAAWKTSSTSWNTEDEQAYQGLVKALGESGYRNFNGFIRDPAANPLHSEEDRELRFSADCADLPYLLRAYTAFKRGLPFSFTSEISGSGPDPRYGSGNKPSGTMSQDDFDSPSSLFQALTNVNSGFFRMSPDVENSDLYPVRVGTDTILPGTVFYDANGHVALVSNVASDGAIRLVQAHTDCTLSRSTFGRQFSAPGRDAGGGFKNWRQVDFAKPKSPRKIPNAELPDFSEEQYSPEFGKRPEKPRDFQEGVRRLLSETGDSFDPVARFEKALRNLGEELENRRMAVEIAASHGIDRRTHPGALPRNIYGATGDWEFYSTPSRDARLKMAFAELYDKTVEAVEGVAQGDKDILFNGSSVDLAETLLSRYDEVAPGLQVRYRKSTGDEVGLDLHQVSKRLFRLSFDPYHSPELRWGAEGDELEGARDEDSEKNLFDREAPLRNRLDIVQTGPTRLDDGPSKPRNIDVRGFLAAYIGEKGKNSEKGGEGRSETMVASGAASASPAVPVQSSGEPTSRRGYLALLIGLLTGALAWGVKSLREHLKSLLEGKPESADHPGPESDAKEAASQSSSQKDSRDLRVPGALGAGLVPLKREDHEEPEGKPAGEAGGDIPSESPDDPDPESGKTIRGKLVVGGGGSFGRKFHRSLKKQGKKCKESEVFGPVLSRFPLKDRENLISRKNFVAFSKVVCRLLVRFDEKAARELGIQPEGFASALAKLLGLQTPPRFDAGHPTIPIICTLSAPAREEVKRIYQTKIGPGKNGPVALGQFAELKRTGTTTFWKNIRFSEGSPKSGPEAGGDEEKNTRNP